MVGRAFGDEVAYKDNVIAGGIKSASGEEGGDQGPEAVDIAYEDESSSIRLRWNKLIGQLRDFEG